MKGLKRFIVIMLSVLILCGAVPSNIADWLKLPDLSLKASAASTLKYGNEDGITRAEWLYDLTIVFDMYAEEEYLPDNYFSDLEESHKYYDAIIKAVQYGVIDIPAGEELKPDEYVTRDFAASTLNFCLGYQPEEGKEYTFTDIDSVTSPDSAQIALNRKWFDLIEGAFSPETLVTSAQVKTMLDDAAAVLETQVVDTGYDNTYEFTDDVIVLPDTVIATEDENGVVSITDCPEIIAENDKFAVYYNGIPVVYTAQSVAVNDNITVIKTESVVTEEAFTEVDAQGVVDSSAMEIVPAEGVEVSVDESSGGISTFAIKKTKTLKAELPIKAGGVTGKISVKIENPYIDYSTSSTGGYVTLNGETTVTYSISASMAQAAGLSKGFTLFTVNIMGVGSFDVTVMVDFSGTASGTVKGFLTAGVQVEKDVGIRAIKGFLQHEAYTSVEAATKVSLRASLGVTKMPVIRAYIYAEVGVKANFSKKTYTDDKKPHQCTHFAAYLFAEYGASASAKLGWVSYEESITNQIYTESNSPMRVVNHYEDGQLVAKCTRGSSYSNFFTKGTSRWSGCGWISANGAYGLNADGTPFKLYDYTLNENNEATITKYNGNAWSVYIPKEIDGYTVVAIGQSAFRYKNLSNVVIPDTVTTIGRSAFDGCSNLKEITLSKNLKSMGYRAFAVTAAEEILIPKSLDSCESYGGEGPFYDCVNLKTVKFETGTTQIATLLFSECNGLEEVTIPDTVTAIEHNAFWCCLNLKKVTIPESVTVIEEYAFNGCSALPEITIPNSVKTIGNSAFDGCSNLKEITLSKNLKSMGYRAFAVTAVEEILIPKSLDSCDSYGGEGPFYDCVNLKTVKFETGTTQIATLLFSECNGLEEVTIPDTVTAIEHNAFWCCLNLKKVTIPESVTVIEEYAFNECSALPEITIPNSVKTIGNSAFKNCTAFTKINIPDSVTTIGRSAFDGCSNLKEITLSKNLKSMGYRAFAVTAVEEILIPKSLDSCDSYGGEGPFYDCVNLKTVKFETGTTQIATHLFSECNGLEEVTIPDTVTAIEHNAFWCCLNLKKVTIPKSVTVIEEYAFNGCSALPEITIPNSVKTIGNSAFKKCAALEKAHLPEGITTIPQYAFAECSSLNDINISKLISLKTIDMYAFSNCDSLEMVVFPESIRMIGSQAFTGCDVLSNIDFADYSITEIKAQTFKGCQSLESVVLPKGLTTIGSQAFMNDTSLVNVTIPESVTSIDSTAFSYPLKTTIQGKAGSYAETFATDGGFTFKDISIPVEGIILKDGVENIILDQGETYRAEFEVYPEDANDVITLTANNSNVTINGHDIYARYSGDTVVTATSTSGLTYEFNLHIRNVKNITVVNNPNKTTYVLGEDFDKTGMSVQVNYYDGSSRIVEDYTISGFDSSAEGENKVTIKWTSASGSTYSTSITLNIVDTRPKLTGIFVDTLPDKVTYELREKLDTTGMVIKGTYTDNSEAVITGYTVSGYNALKKGVQTITVTYNGFTTTFTVAVGQTPHEHSYDNDCDDTCNVVGCGYTRTVTHDFADATCIAPKTCKVCGETEGEALDHDFADATCAAPKTCKVCGETEGEALDHDFADATCAAPKTCKVCGETEGEALDHDFADATCAVPKTCKVCGETEGESLGHDFADATCTDPKTCTVCGVTSGSKLSHKSDAGTVTKKATCTATGTKTYKCTLCKATIKTETIAKVAHKYDSGKVTKAATCKATGVKTYTCSVCKGTKTETIAKLTTHTYSNNCDKSCNVCGKTRTVGAHKYSNSCDTTCNYCNAKRTIKHTYSNNCDTSCNVCKATRTITHSYKTTTTKATLSKNGSIVKKCTICGKVVSNTAIKCAKTFKLSATTYTYDGKAKTPSVTVKDSAGKTLKKNTDYTVTYASGRKNVGTYKVTIKMIGKYSGTKTLTFKINPAKTTVSKLTAGKKSITVGITKNSTQVTGYQIQYSTSKTFSNATAKTISSYKTTKYTLKSLSAKKTYYVRVRTYKTVGNTKYYSGWSTYKYVKTK